MNVSRVYARFSPPADMLFRQAMAAAGRHRVVRVHHLIAASGDGQGCVSAGVSRDPGPVVPPLWTTQATQTCDRDPAGCLDAPLSNSPTIRRVLNLAADRAGHDVFPILPAHLLAMAACCWEEESPPYRPDSAKVANLCLTLGVPPLPAYASHSKPSAAESVTEAGEDRLDTRVPTVEELEAMFAPAVTAEDLLRLYMDMQETQDPARREWLAWKLFYLRERG